MRIFFNIFNQLLILVVSLYLLFIASNWSDEALKPEVKTILNWQLPAPSVLENNGYLILLGMNAAFDQDAYQVGKAKVEKELVNFELARKTQTRTPAKDNTSFMPYQESAGLQDYICFYNQVENCVTFYLQQDVEKLKQIIATQQALLSRYVAMKASRQFVEVSTPMSNLDFGGVSAHAVAVELDYIQTVLDITSGNENAGIQRFVDNALHNRTILKNSATNAARDWSLIQVQRDVRILSELMTKYPALAKPYKQKFLPLLAPISTHEYALQTPFMQERNDSLVLFSMLISAQELTEKTAKSGFLEKLKGVQFQPNAALNFMYDWKSLSHKIAQADAQHLEVVKAQVESDKKALLGFGYKPYYFKNSLGKILVTTFDVSGLLNKVETVHDAEGYIRLVHLQLELLAGNTPKSQMAQMFAQYPNPYTAKPMQYDDDKKLIIFEGRDNSQAYPKKDVYSVPFSPKS